MGLQCSPDGSVPVNWSKRFSMSLSTVSFQASCRLVLSSSGAMPTSRLANLGGTIMLQISRHRSLDGPSMGVRA